MNIELRTAIVVGSYTPQFLSMMDELDMMEENKRKFIYTNNKSLIDQGLAKRKAIAREERYLAKSRGSKLTLNDVDIATGVAEDKNCKKDLTYFVSMQAVESL